ncbi:MAG: hypothetical protein QM763_04190 [Agriterribacter sp.]
MSDSNNVFDIELINLEDINISAASIENKTEFTALDSTSYSHDVDYRFKFGVNKSQKKIRAIFECKIFTFNNLREKIEVEGNFDIAYVFLIKNFDDLINVSEHLELEDNLVLSIANIIYSTSRGIIYTRCQGTILNNVILPILSTKKLKELLA